MSIKQKIIAGVLLAANMFPLVGAMENNNGQQQNVPVPPPVAAQVAQPGVALTPQAAAQATMLGIFPDPPATAQIAPLEIVPIQPSATQVAMPEIFPGPPVTAQTAQPGAFPVSSVAAQAMPQGTIFVPQRIILPVINPAVGIPVTQTFNANGMFNFMRVPLLYGCNPFLINVVYRAYSCKGLKESLRSSAPNLTPPQDALLYLLDIMDGISPFENGKYMQSVTYLNNFIGDDKPLNFIQHFFKNILDPKNNLIDLLVFNIDNPRGINVVKLGECNVSKDTVIVDINPKEAFYCSNCMLTNLLGLRPKNGLIYDLVCFSCLDTDIKNVCTVIRQEDGNWYEYSNRGVKVLCGHEAVLLATQAFSLVYHKR